MRYQLIALTILAGMIAAATPAVAQIETIAENLTLPFVSPRAEAEQRIGITDITVTYHRPAVRGREIWGDLVPYGKDQPYPWRAGANENTTIHFSDDVKVEGFDLPAGAYGFHIYPSEKMWTLIFSKNATSWGSFFYSPAEDALRIEVEPQNVPHREWLMYGFEDLTEDSAYVFLHWEEKKVRFQVEVDVHDIVLRSIREELRNIPGFTWQGYYQAANYSLQNELNYEEALEWIDQSIRRQENDFNLRVKGQLLARTGKPEEARDVLEQALEIAPERRKDAVRQILEDVG